VKPVFTPSTVPAGTSCVAKFGTVAEASAVQVGTPVVEIALIWFPAAQVIDSVPPRAVADGNGICVELTAVVVVMIVPVVGKTAVELTPVPPLAVARMPFV
jgi:hypothetical protein